MPRFVAFLRALNVGGGHVVKMDVLKRAFERMGFADVETFIASGNVVFSAKAAKGHEAKISRALEQQLAYEVAPFVRTLSELAAVAAHEPFPKADVEAAPTFCVGFLSAKPDAAARKRLKALETDADRFHVRGREFWWLSKNRQGGAAISGRVLEKTLGQPTTLRGVKTILKMAARYGAFR